jgi:hypothetical protein
MAKTYNPLDSVTVGSVLTASDYNKAVENSNNYRVPPMVKCVRSGNDTGYTTEKSVPWNGTDEYDTEDPGMHDPAADNTRITFRTAGIYIVTFAIRMTFTGSPTFLDALIRLNGTTNIGEDFRTSTSSAYAAMISATLNASVGDFVEARCQASSASTATITDLSNSYFSAHWLGQVS